jgi:hypothetical protein
MRYSTSPRYFENLDSNKGEFGYRWDCGCECGARFNDYDVIRNRRGDAFCPECHEEDFVELQGSRNFKATRR